MTIQSTSMDAQFGARLERVFGSNSAIGNRVGKNNSSNLRKEMKTMLEEMRQVLRKDLEDEIGNIVKQASSEILGSDSFSKAFGSGLEKALGQIVAGKSIDARSVANSAAKSLTPYVDDLFRKSTSQAADELSSLFNLAQRNL